MKKLCTAILLAFLGSMLAPAAHAQFAVFDASNFGEAVQEFGQLEQMYTTAVETRDQIVLAYNLAYQMSQMPQNLAACYQSQASQWTNLSAPNTYGNTSAWVNALDIGSPAQAAQGYRDAVVQVQSYPGGGLAAQDAQTQATIQNQYATSELAQGATTSTLATLGTIRSNSQALAQKLANLDADTYSTDPSQQTQNALLGKINTATLLQIRSQQDTKLDFLFWGWFKAFFGFSFYQVIASAFIFIFAKVLLALLGVIGPISISNAFTILPALIVTLFVCIFGLFKIPELTGAILSGRTGTWVNPLG